MFRQVQNYLSVLAILVFVPNLVLMRQVALYLE
jgi:hypothetical protein